ncbi:isopenicillin N synthase family dioxygenase [Phyllobacterium calauticae]|jgi:isopenicillin N synthase-like dioxygenase|uniref:isopenicillin N synthase family dioxygenase n=1 Tax=Phyllobacterium calauticae TaxID=2817027 RepID=UPI001CBCADBC|nr:isopenicillin N synthase family oxygenase [Phyllobacterium calauticae]MBZ3693632.1 isopenicillin N synthase family oxygenase [Phyllobacterium calauticae]
MSALPKTDTLPTLDFGRYRDPEEREAFFEDLRHAARIYGFFYLSGHGVAEQLQRDIVAVSKRFFALPKEDKIAVEMVNSPHFRGYTRAGWERTRGQADWREQFDVGAERAVIQQDPTTPSWSRLQGPNQWPDSLPDLKSIVLEWQSELTRVAIELLQAFATALGQEKDVFGPIYEKAPNQHLKIIRYPGRDATGSDQGVGAHKDSGFLTLLLQDVQGGLQVEKDGGWIDATPVPGTFVINIGEILELASNGYLKATVHRVVSPPSGKDRLSVAFFFGADLNANVPLLTLPDDLAREAGGADTDPDNPLFREVGRNYLKGRLRSHPDVAQRHHADLL